MGGDAVEGDPDLVGRVAIVTGAGRGLGLAMASGLALAGCRVVGTQARNPSELLALAAFAPDRVLTLRADVSDPGDCERLVEAALSRFGRLDILVNNAGRGMRTISERFLVEPARFWHADINAWRTIVDTNVNGPFYMARAAVPPMLKAGWGRIVNISISHETMRRSGFSPYGPSKAALESASVIWAQDLAGTGVTVNVLLPGGATRTGMIPKEMPAQLASSLLDPAIVVPPLLYLASARSDGVTGRRFVAKSWPAVEGAGWVLPE